MWVLIAVAILFVFGMLADDAIEKRDKRNIALARTDPAAAGWQKMVAGVYQGVDHLPHSRGSDYLKSVVRFANGRSHVFLGYGGYLTVGFPAGTPISIWRDKSRFPQDIVKVEGSSVATAPLHPITAREPDEDAISDLVSLSLREVDNLVFQRQITPVIVRHVAELKHALSCLPTVLKRFGHGTSERHEIVQIPMSHLPRLLRTYGDLTLDLRTKREQEVLDSLRRMKAEVERIADRAADADDIEFGTCRRVIELKYPS